MDEKKLLEIISELRSKGREWQTVDAKQELRLQELGEKAEFVKDVVAMANNGEPSYIVIGLQDGTFTDIGKLTSHHLKNNLNQVLADKIDPPVVVDYQEFTINGNEYGLIEISGYNLPYIVARDLVANKEDRKQIRIYKGTIFVRHGDRTEGIGRAELDELLRKKDIRKAFEQETEYAQQLIFERPFAWEYRLTAELLRAKLAPINRQVTELQQGLVYRKTVRIKGMEFPYWTGAKCSDLANLVGITNKVLNEEIPKSWGLPGVAGDPLEIKNAVDKLISVCQELVEWETEIRYALVPRPVQNIKQMMEGWTTQFLSEINSVHEKLTEPFKQQANPTGVISINLVFEPPARIDEVMAEIHRLQNNPEEMMNLFLESF